MDPCQKLREAFPRLFPPSIDPWYGEVRCGAGWEQILADLMVGLNAIGNPDLRVSQAKEKFGGLRVYLDGVRDEDEAEVGRLVDAAEAKAYETCERCGASGTLRPRSWLVVLCDTCSRKRK